MSAHPRLLTAEYRVTPRRLTERVLVDYNQNARGPHRQLGLPACAPAPAKPPSRHRRRVGGGSERAVLRIEDFPDRHRAASGSGAAAGGDLFAPKLLARQRVSLPARTCASRRGPGASRGPAERATASSPARLNGACGHPTSRSTASCRSSSGGGSAAGMPERLDHSSRHQPDVLVSEVLQSSVCPRHLVAGGHQGQHELAPSPSRQTIVDQPQFVMVLRLRFDHARTRRALRGGHVLERHFARQLTSASPMWRTRTTSRPGASPDRDRARACLISLGTMRLAVVAGLLPGTPPLHSLEGRRVDDTAAERRRVNCYRLFRSPALDTRARRPVRSSMHPPGRRTSCEFRSRPAWQQARGAVGTRDDALFGRSVAACFREALEAAGAGEAGTRVERARCARLHQFGQGYPVIVAPAGARVIRSRGDRPARARGP